MKKGLLKFVAGVLAACSMVGLCGCGGNVSTSGDGVKTAQVWMGVGHSKQFWEETINEFNQGYGKEIGVNLVLTAKTDSAYTQALDVAINSDQLPDFFMSGDLKKLVEKNQIAALSDMPGMEEFLADYEDMLVEKTHTYEGKTYSIPGSLTTRGLIYNKDMFKAAGIVDENGEAEAPVTFEDVREYAKLLTNTDKGEYGIAFPVKWGAWIESDILTLSQSTSGVFMYNPVEGKFDFDGCKPALEMIMGIKEDGSLYPGAEGLDNDPARARFAEGKIGMKIAYSFDVGVLNEQFPAKCDWGVAPLPVVAEDNCYKQHAQTSQSLQVSTKGVENLGEEKAALVFKWLYSKENIGKMYAKGLEIPCNWDWVKDVELETDAKGWKEFCELANISAVRSTGNNPRNMEGEKSVKEVLVDGIWAGKTSIDDGIAELNEICNRAMEKYNSENPDIDPAQYLETNWFEKVKR